MRIVTVIYITTIHSHAALLKPVKDKSKRDQVTSKKFLQPSPMRTG